MSRRSCSQESGVALAVRRGEWSEPLQAHLRECAICRGVQESARWMQALEQERAPEAHESLPDAQILWLRAQLSERQAAAERAHNALQWVEIACVAAACAVTAGLRRLASVTPTPKPQTCEAVAGGEVPEHRPRFERGLDLRDELGGTEVARDCDRPWEQLVQVIAYPVRVCTAGRGGQHVGAGEGGRGVSGIYGLSAQSHTKSTHNWHGRSISPHRTDVSE